MRAIPLPGWARLVDGWLKRLASPVRVRRPGLCLGREPGGRDVACRVGELQRRPDAMVKAAGRSVSGRQAGGWGGTSFASHLCRSRMTVCGVAP